MIAASVSLLVAAGLASAQLAITEIFENPPNGGDQNFEHIEIYGPPGFSLTGYALALVKGGEDERPADDIPDGDKTSEIDEAFSLDGWSIGPNGFFVIYNTGAFGATGLSPLLTPNPTYQFFQPESPSNKRFLNGASFTTLHIPSVFDPGETADRLNNDGSSTYLLIRRRPFHALSSGGASVYATGYAWAKDTSPDVDFNGRLDLGDEHTLGLPIYFSEGANGGQSTAAALEPVQIVDEVSWSNTGGKEYNISGRGEMSNEISETPGFNPDAVSRVRYLGGPATFGGSTIGNDGVLTPRTIADESWVYGETRDYAIGAAPDSDNIQAGAPGYLEYRPEFYDVRTGRAELNWLSPTDPDGNRYSYSGPGSPNPLVTPFFEQTAAFDPANGTLRFEPYPIVGFELTPGTFNDTKPGTALVGTAIATQFRWVKGDFNFDGVVDCADRTLIAQAAADARTLDEVTTLTDNRNTATTADDRTYQGYRLRLEGFNGTLAMIRMSLSDGSTGDWTTGQVIDTTMGSPSFGRIVAWGGAVTASDFAAFDSEFPNACPPPCVADFNRSGSATVQDIFDFLVAYFANSPAADINGVGGITVQDIFDFLAAYFAGC